MAALFGAWRWRQHGNMTIKFPQHPPDTQVMLQPLLRLRRRRSALWGRPTTTLGLPSGLRVDVPPPSLRCAPLSVWQRLLFWLMAATPQDAAPPVNRLPGVRAAFLVTLADVDGDEAQALRLRISQCRSLRELWHARAELFRLVGVAHSQAVADQRLAQLNRHFPSRAPRSQFAPL